MLTTLDPKRNPIPRGTRRGFRAEADRAGGLNAAPQPAAARQQEQLPGFTPLLEEIELAGWSSHRRRLSGNFHDWMLLADRRVMVAVGQAGSASASDPTECALASQAAWATIRAHALHAADAGDLLSLATRSLWPVARSAVPVDVAIALLEPIGGRVSVAVAGEAMLWRVRAATIERPCEHQPSLGAAGDFSYQSHELTLSLRERLLLVADQPAHRTKSLAVAMEAAFRRLDSQSHRRMTASDAVSLARTQLDVDDDHGAALPASIVAVRRR